MLNRIEKLQGGLKDFQGPTYKKVFLANLLSSGLRFFENAQKFEAEYFFQKVEAYLNSADRAHSSGSFVLESASGKPVKAPASTFEKLKLVWRQQRIKSTESVLFKSTGKLSTLENQLYRDKLDDLKSKSVSQKTDSTLLELRRQLYRRVLKSQKISLRKNGSNSNPSLIPTTNSQQITGPYNDRYNLGSVLTLTQNTDPAWTEEFLDLYRRLLDMQGLTTALPHNKK